VTALLEHFDHDVNTGSGGGHVDLVPSLNPSQLYIFLQKCNEANHIYKLNGQKFHKSTTLQCYKAIRLHKLWPLMTSTGASVSWNNTPTENGSPLLYWFQKGCHTNTHSRLSCDDSQSLSQWQICDKSTVSPQSKVYKIVAKSQVKYWNCLPD